MKIVFFELEKWEIGYLKERIHGHESEFYTTKVEETDSDSIYDADIVSTFIFSRMDKETLDKFPNLKLVNSMSTGFDHIDLEECKKRGIIVTNVPAYGENTVSEHAFGLLLNLSKNIHKAYIRTHEQDTFSFDGLMGFDLKGKTIGVIGTGRIGCYSIKIAKGFGLNVIAYDAYPKRGLDEDLGFKYVSLDELYAQSDVITIHVPLLDSTHHLINKESISKMKEGMIIINTSRGPVIDTDALIEGLQNGKVKGAGLDVLEGELMVKDEKELVHKYGTLPKRQLELLLEDHALMDMDNVIITPHLAFYTKEALQRILDTTLTNVFDCVESREYKNQVKK